SRPTPNHTLKELPMFRIAAAFTILLVACGDPPMSRITTPGGATFGKAPSNRTATFVMPVPSSALSIRGDGLFPDGSGSDYTAGVCAVTATIFAPNPTQDAVLETLGHQSCAPYPKSSSPRGVTVDYGNGTETFSGTFNVHDLGTVTGTSLRFFG